MAPVMVRFSVVEGLYKGTNIPFTHRLMWVQVAPGTWVVIGCEVL